MSTRSLPSPEMGQTPLERWIVGYPGIILALLWGFAEGTFFFIIPDVFLSYAAILNWRRTWRHVLASTLGALLGGALLFQWSTAAPVQARGAISRVPFVTEGMFAQVDSGFRSHGLLSVFLGSVSGIPYKLYAVEGPKFCSEMEFLIATPPARLIRFLLTWSGFGAVARWLQMKYGWREWKPTLAHAAVWIMVYSFYWGRLLHR